MTTEVFLIPAQTSEHWAAFLIHNGVHRFEGRDLDALVLIFEHDRDASKARLALTERVETLSQGDDGHIGLLVKSEVGTEERLVWINEVLCVSFDAYQVITIDSEPEEMRRIEHVLSKL